jgi:hypothetical protein
MRIIFSERAGAAPAAGQAVSAARLTTAAGKCYAEAQKFALHHPWVIDGTGDAF